MDTHSAAAQLSSKIRVLISFVINTRTTVVPISDIIFRYSSYIYTVGTLATVYLV